jgi:heme-degrading monooxygenase HmoA
LCFAKTPFGSEKNRFGFELAKNIEEKFPARMGRLADSPGLQSLALVKDSQGGQGIVLVVEQRPSCD